MGQVMGNYTGVTPTLTTKRNPVRRLGEHPEEPKQGLFLRHFSWGFKIWQVRYTQLKLSGININS